MAAPTIYPELPWSWESRVARALVALLLADAALVSYTAGRIKGIEVEELARLGDVITPALLVAVDATEEERRGGRSSDYSLTLAVIHVGTHEGAAVESSREWLTTRALGQVRRTIRAAEPNGLRDVDTGARLTMDLVSFERRRAGRLSAANAAIYTPQLVTFTAWVDEVTEDVL